MEAVKGLTNLQMELLKIFSIQLEEQQLKEIRTLLSRYFAENATAEMDRLWKERGWSSETVQQWAKEHLRNNSKD